MKQENNAAQHMRCECKHESVPPPLIFVFNFLVTQWDGYYRASNIQVLYYKAQKVLSSVSKFLVMM